MQAVGEFERALIGGVIMAGGFHAVFRRQQNGGNNIARSVHKHLHSARRNHVIVLQGWQIDFVEQLPLREFAFDLHRGILRERRFNRRRLRA